MFKAARNVKLLTLLAGVVSLSLLAACTTPEPTATPAATATATPDPTATPTPAPSPTATATPTPTATPTTAPLTVNPIAINPEEDPDGFIAALPPDEVDCASDAVGGLSVFRDLVAAPDGLDEAATPGQMDALTACIGSQTVQNVMIGRLAAEAGGLSNETIACVADQTSDIEFSNIFRGLDLGGEDLKSAVLALFCLSPAERLAFEQGNPSDDGDSTVGTIDGFECMVGAAGPEILDTFADLSDSDGTPDFVLLSELVPLLDECGMIDRGPAGDTGMSGEQIICLFQEVDPEVMNSLVSADAGSTPDIAVLVTVLAGFEFCGIELDIPSDPARR